MKSKNSWKKMKCSRGSFSLESKWKMSTEQRGSGALQTEKPQDVKTQGTIQGRSKSRGRSQESGERLHPK